MKRDACRTATVYWKQTPRRDSLVDITVNNVSPTRTGFSMLQSTAEAPTRRPATELQYCLPGELVRGTKYKVAVCGVTTGLKGEVTFRAGKTSCAVRGRVVWSQSLWGDRERGRVVWNHNIIFVG